MIFFYMKTLKKNACYVMVSGRAEVRIDGKLKTVILEEQLFCELALIANNARTATITTIQPHSILKIPKIPKTLTTPTDQSN